MKKFNIAKLTKNGYTKIVGGGTNAAAGCQTDSDGLEPWCDDDWTEDDC